MDIPPPSYDDIESGNCRGTPTSPPPNQQHMPAMNSSASVFYTVNAAAQVQQQQQRGNNTVYVTQGQPGKNISAP